MNRENISDTSFINFIPSIFDRAQERLKGNNFSQLWESNIWLTTQSCSSGSWIRSFWMWKAFRSWRQQHQRQQRHQQQRHRQQRQQWHRHQRQWQHYRLQGGDIDLPISNGNIENCLSEVDIFSFWLILLGIIYRLEEIYRNMVQYHQTVAIRYFKPRLSLKKVSFVSSWLASLKWHHGAGIWLQL